MNSRDGVCGWTGARKGKQYVELPDRKAKTVRNIGGLDPFSCLQVKIITYLISVRFHSLTTATN